MNTPFTAVAVIAVFSAAIIYGTDLFCTLVLGLAASARPTAPADLIGGIQE